SEPAPTQPVPFPDDAPGPVRGRRSAPIYDDDELEAEQDGVAEPQAWTLPTEVTSEVTAAEPGAPGPIAAVPSSSAAPVGPVSAVPPVTRVPAPVAPPEREPWAPALSPTPEGDAFPETSGAVSAIVGAPDAGAPRSALASVSALHPRPHVPDDEDIFDETVVTRRKRTPWTLVPPSGRSIPITSDVVILGRRPGADPAFPDAQLVAIDDDTRTVSKTHARLELRDDAWTIVDLDSTNGVLLTDAAGAEVEAAPGVGSRVGERFLLGDAELRLERSEA
ncbi:FHA domain-containing protein, partial [Microbacterium ulmi]